MAQLFLRGLRTSSPPQFGHTFFIPAVHVAQKVHSKVQMNASPVGINAAWHFSQIPRISSAIAYSLRNSTSDRSFMTTSAPVR
jgi:hypothetical protein